MSKKINSCACERAGVLLSGINVMMCRYAVVRRELLSSIIWESCLLFWEQRGGIRRQAEMGPVEHL